MKNWKTWAGAGITAAAGSITGSMNLSGLSSSLVSGVGSSLNSGLATGDWGDSFKQGAITTFGNYIGNSISVGITGEGGLNTANEYTKQLISNYTTFAARKLLGSDEKFDMNVIGNVDTVSMVINQTYSGIKSRRQEEYERKNRDKLLESGLSPEEVEKTLSETGSAEAGAKAADRFKDPLADLDMALSGVFVSLGRGLGQTMNQIGESIKNGADAVIGAVQDFGQSVKNKVVYGVYGTNDSYEVRYAKAKLEVEEERRQGLVWAGDGMMLAGDGGMTDTGIPGFMYNTGMYGKKVNPDCKDAMEKKNIYFTDPEDEKARKEIEESRNEKMSKEQARTEEIARRKGLNIDDKNEGILSTVKDFFANTVWGGVKDLAFKAYNWITGNSIDNQSMVERAVTKDLLDKDTVRKNISNAAGSGLVALLDETGKSIEDAKSKGVSIYGNLSEDQRDRYEKNIFDAGWKGVVEGYGENALSNLKNTKNPIDKTLGAVMIGGYLVNQERNNREWKFKYKNIEIGHDKKKGKYINFSIKHNY